MRAEGEFTIYPASPLSTHSSPSLKILHRTQSPGAQGGADPRQCRVWGQREVS